jgi:hypothetical protein
VAAFQALGVEPALGRGFRKGDDLPGAEPVVLLGDTIWRERYGASPGIVGTAIRGNGVMRTVIGVMPPKFAFPIREALWPPCRSVRWPGLVASFLPARRVTRVDPVIALATE